MSGLGQRLDRLEHQIRRVPAEEFTALDAAVVARVRAGFSDVERLGVDVAIGRILAGVRLSPDDRRWLVQYCAAWGRARALVVDAGDDHVDAEPAIRQVAVDLGLDPDAVVAEAGAILAEWGEP